ncbi:hypothetical protein [uncultured Lentilactobacillus sp.]|uniref:hypothetical protein n=1 Tax=uncultured Lentilactobacillus sp. TaxID=2805375 RepID=UPI002592F42A|nr:hypothetical protein [uncultured Lentilactobacillus sp.]
MVEIVEFYNSNINRLNGLAQQAVKDVNQYMRLQLDIPDFKVKAPPVLRKNHAWYIWTVKQIERLEEQMNLLIEELGVVNLTDPQTGDLIDRLYLWKPRTLVIDDKYIEKLTNSFKACTLVFDQIEKSLEPYKQAWKGVK